MTVEVNLTKTRSQHLNKHDGEAVLGASGVSIDTSGKIWRLDSTNSVNWDRFPAMPPFAFTASRDYIKHLIRKRSPGTVNTTYDKLVTSFRHLRPKHKNHFTDNGDLSLGYFEDLATALRKDKALSEGVILNTLSSFRRLYLWACDAGYDGFCADAALELEEKKIGGHQIGAAVLRSDPTEGPLDDVEITSVAHSLTAAMIASPRKIALRDAVITALAMAWGLYARHLYLMNEDDYSTETLPDGSVRHFIKVPRIKKGTARPRKQWKLRELDPRYGAWIHELIQENARLRASNMQWDHNLYDKALFHGRTGGALLNSPFSRDTYRLTPVAFNCALDRVINMLDIKGRDKNALKLTFRRLRYTFASRLVSLGAAPKEVAEALDHSSTNHVMIYYDGRQSILRRIENKVVLELASTARYFHGSVIRKEDDAPRGADPKSRIKWPIKQDKAVKTVGNCGSFAYCGLAAPRACYLCALFHPWLDGPHEAVLNDLVAERDEKEGRGVPAPVIKPLSDTIIAIAQTILACEEMRAATNREGVL